MAFLAFCFYAVSTFMHAALLCHLFLFFKHSTSFNKELIVALANLSEDMAQIQDFSTSAHRYKDVLLSRPTSPHYSSGTKRKVQERKYVFDWTNNWVFPVLAVNAEHCMWCWCFRINQQLTAADVPWDSFCGCVPWEQNQCQCCCLRSYNCLWILPVINTVG